MNLPDFDELVAMAESSPEELERLRREMVQRIIDSSNNEEVQRKLRGLQFRIDAKIRQARTPLAACIMISQMMHESLFELRESLLNQDPSKRTVDVAQQPPAKILSLAEARLKRAARLA